MLNYVNEIKKKNLSDISKALDKNIFNKCILHLPV